MTTPNNIRFWAYVNGCYVKLTLRYGQSLAHYEGGPTEEGYDRTFTAWEHDGANVYREYSREASDCDGRMSWGGESVCAVADLREIEPYYDAEETPDPAVKLPGWENETRYQRDHQAEAAGY